MFHLLWPVSYTIMFVSFVTGSVRSEEQNRHAEPSTELINLLKQGQNTGELPAGFVIRLEAHLSHRVPADPAIRDKLEAGGVDLSQRLDEVWEFSDNRVHKATMKADKTGMKRLYERAESTSDKTQQLCRELLTADISSLVDPQGLGSLHFAGTDYDQGERSIVFLKDGKELLLVGEDCATAGFPEKEARVFSRLYESLADNARKAFLKKTFE